MWDDTDESVGIVLGDLANHGMLMFFMLFVLAVLFINDPKKEAAENIDPPNQGVLRVEVFWPDNQNIDVDLWVDGPVGDPVGYSNKGSELWNLLRDDLGTHAGGVPDLSGVNMETSYTRGIWDGEYIINIHLYALTHTQAGVWKDAAGEWHPDAESKLPVPVRVILYFKENRDSPERQLVFSDVQLKAPAQELTVFRFQVIDFKPDLSTLNNLQKKLRTPDSSGPTGHPF